ncbi:MAG: MoxR family ATPase [Caldilineaceae bacterium]|nr:MoxR family ATPase [Caldilineaceae bacterium]MDE0632411.1 MoxR family ATPase [Caldilineaceae bacterium]
MQEVQAVANRIIANVEKVIIGKDREVRMTVVALLCEGHLLIEDVPGVGKTMLARAIARTVGSTYRRIQFTPDMLPSDVTGVSVFNQKTLEFEFRPGPIMAQIVLSDEINRATPKTQSALLEAMEERQVTVDGTTYDMSRPFLVLATQNPIEYEGTFPLPEAQVDRFLMRIRLGYPLKAHEVNILGLQALTHPIEDLERTVSVEELSKAQEAVRDMYVDDSVKEYIVDLVATTRDHPDVYLGASPRGSLALFRAARAWAAIDGREYVLPDDVKLLAESTLAHRLIVSPSARIKNVDAAQVIEDALAHTPVPGSRVRAA